MQDPDPVRTRLAALAMGGIVVLSLSLFNPATLTLLPGSVALLALGALGALRWRRFGLLAWRMKWFFLSLVVFFGWLGSSSGAQAAAGFLPAAGGLQEAVLRIAALLLVVGWVVWLTTAFDVSTQSAGLNRWLAPLGLTGLRVDRFSARLFLALQYFETGQGDFRRLVGEGGRMGRGRIGAAREFLVVRVAGILSGPGAEQGQIAVNSHGAVPGTESIRVVGMQVGLLWLAVGISFLVSAVGG